MRRLYDFAIDRGIQFVSDEVFHPIYHGRTGASAATLPQATVIGDLSKAFSLSGLRLGWIVERDAQRRARYLNARQYFTVSNTAIAELAAEIAVRHSDTILGRTLEVAQSNLRYADALLADLSDVIEWVRPEGGMTGFPRFVSGINTRPFCEEAARQGLLLVPGDCFDVPDHFRLGFGVGREWYPAAMSRLATLIRAA
jgi:aspartate/methionine/tyrosine aminotransferase